MDRTPTTPTHAPPTLPTAEEFARRHARDYVELIDGLVEPIMPGGTRHGRACTNVILHPGGFIRAHRLGVVCSSDTFVLTRRNPDRPVGGDGFAKFSD